VTADADWRSFIISSWRSFRDQLRRQGNHYPPAPLLHVAWGVRKDSLRGISLGDLQDRPGPEASGEVETGESAGREETKKLRR
jgi:hypothetical protein